MSKGEIEKRFAMKNILFILVLILFTVSAYTQETNYFKTKRDYIYSALYIDSIGDTITNETLTLRVLDRRWFAQPWLQRSVRYIFHTDTVGYKNYIDPEVYFRERNARKYKENGEFPLAKKSTTGGYQKDGYFYMHPPRTNQYRMLFYAAHPFFSSSVLEKGSDTITLEWIDIYPLGHMNHEYHFNTNNKRSLFGDSINVYQVNANSHLVSKKKKEHFVTNRSFYVSTLDGLFSFEYGFLKMHYEFKNGVRIEFDLLEVVAS